MKNLFIVFVLTLSLAFSLSAQSKIGRFTLGGGVSFESTTDKTDPASTEHTTSSFSIIPQLGYYISDAVKLGIGIGYSNNTTEDKPLSGTSHKYTNNSFIINPFARFYIPASEKVDLFLEGNFSFTTGSYEYTPGTSKGDMTAIGIFITPGIEYWISQRISLDASLGQIGYFTNTNTPDGTPTVKYTNDSFKFNFNLSTVELGINVLL